MISPKDFQPVLSCLQKIGLCFHDSETSVNDLNKDLEMIHN